MRRLMLWSYAHPFLVVIIILAACALAATQVTKIQVDASAKSMMAQGDPSMDVYKDTVEEFGSDSILVVYARDGHLFSPERLQKLEDMVYAFEEIEGVLKVESLFSVTSFNSVDGFLESAPLVDWVPETQEEADEVKANALKNPNLIGTIVSSDGTATAINLFIDPANTDPTFNLDLTAAVEKILEPHEGGFETLIQLGAPYNFKVINDIVFADQMTLVPMATVVLLLMLVATTRSASGAILPMLTAGTSVLMTMGFMGVAGIPLTVLTFIVPSLIIVIGSTEDIHILCEYMEGMHEHGGVKELAVKFMTSKVGTAVMLTALTTFLGFLSISINKIALLKQFGITASFGMFVNPLITCLVAPVYLRWFGAKEPKEHKDGRFDILIGRLADVVTHIVHHHKKATLWVTLGGAVLIGLFGLTLHVDNDVLGYFKKDSQIIKRVEALEQNMAGASTFFVRISAGHPAAFKNPENLRQVDRLQKWMAEYPGFDKTTTLTDYLKLINQQMNGGGKEYFAIPDSEELVSQYLLFLRRDEIESYVTPGLDEVNILVRHSINSSYELKQALADLDKAIAEIIDPHLLSRVTGENILINDAADSIAIGQVQGIGLLLLVIFVIMSVLFVNTKAGGLSLIPNLFPVFVNFGIMAIFDIPLNTGTCMVAAVAIGIAVDDTIHFMSRYNTEMRELQNRDKAVDVCIRSEITPVISTSLALSMGFAVLAFAQFVPVMHFGLLSAGVMVVALIGDMFVTPILLSSTQLITLWDMVALKLHREVLERSSLFQDMRPWQVKKVVLLGRFQEKAAGELAVSQGEHGKSMYLLLSGSATVFGRDESTGREMEFARLAAGDVFGEIALVEPGPRSANVKAEEDVQYIEIDWDGLKRIRRVYPRIASRLFLNLSRIMGERLATTDKMLFSK